jgi:ABC-2 type transport system permease protein
VSSLLLALRLGRWGIAGFAALAFVSTLVQALAYYTIAGQTAAQQAAFGATIATLASHFTAILPPPIRPETVGGYVEWRGFHALGLIFGVWALASASGMSRVDEERGVIEATLAAGASRVELIAARFAAFTIGALLASLAAAAGFVAGVLAHHDSVNSSGVLEELLLLAALAVCCYSIALLVAQVSSPRTATAAAGIALLALFLINSLSRTFSSLDTARWLSPFRYYDLNQPLPPGGTFDARSIVLLVAIAVVATAAAAAAFSLRDIGSPLIKVPGVRHATRYDASSAPWWRLPIVRELYERRVALVAWTAGMAVLAVVFVSLTRTTIQPLLAVPALLPYFTAIVHGDIYPAVLGFVWFNFAQLLFAAFAVTQVARWAADDTDGRLEIVLSQPRSRAGVMVERFAVLIAGAAIVAAATGIAVFYASRSQGIELNQQRVIAASLMLVPFALVFASAGALLAAWRPRAAVGLLGAIAFASYLDTEVGPLLGWPLWVQELSAFRLFGTPLSSGVDGRSLALMLLIATAMIGSSILVMQRRDVGA